MMDNNNNSESTFEELLKRRVFDFVVDREISWSLVDDANNVLEKKNTRNKERETQREEAFLFIITNI